MEKGIIPIVTERDLDNYEKHLSRIEIPQKICSNTQEVIRKTSFGHHLTACKGKLVKVEICCSGCLQAKVGILLDVGEDYIVIKNSGVAVSTVVPIVNIHCITFIHNNDRRQIGKY